MVDSKVSSIVDAIIDRINNDEIIVRLKTMMVETGDRTIQETISFHQEMKIEEEIDRVWMEDPDNYEEVCHEVNRLLMGRERE